ncbi:hypothetical protein ColLi_10289 [Colletotrichum liriopes]|uniref:Uncharacterized protein n=1 Tax=Colletotrichum liriopes TaxID=708192 RepID=A0AA37GUE2_9PEZI|nr:hypothetical protein ColLi_10289 [Colletotrichum liriopes]
MKNRYLKIITIGHVVAAVIIQGAVLCLMRKNTINKEESENREDKSKEKRAEESAETPNKDNIPPRPSGESARSTSSSSTVVSLSEKAGFLDHFTSKIPGIQKTETRPASEEANIDSPKKEETTAEGLGNFFMGVLGLSPGHIMMFYGVVGIAKEIFINRRITDARQQRDVRDTFILFGVLVGVVVIISILGVVSKVYADDKQPQDEESAEREAGKQTQAAEVKKMKEAVIFGTVMLSGLLSLWCQYFVLAAAARDTHGSMHLRETSNLSLVYLILSKLLLFAF